MDLDNIKKSWQQAEIKPTIDEHKIQQMLDNKGKGAFENLKKTEKVFLWLLLPCLLAGAVFFRMHWLPGALYAVLMVYAFFWQRYKIKYLDRVNLGEMTVLEATKCITRYKKFLYREIIIGIVFIPVFFWTYTFFGMKNLMAGMHDGITPDSDHLLIMFIAMVVLTVFLTFLIYKLLYVKNIKKIEESIREVKEFEQDNE